MPKAQSLFKHLEHLNGHIDVLIDGERYGDVFKKLPLSPKGKEIWDSCFSHPTCTKDLDDGWRKAIDFCFSHSACSKNLDDWLKAIDPSTIPFQLNYRKKLVHEYKGFQPAWLSLFWAKRLRAEIQNRNTDCYLRRLDDLVGYLERNIPIDPTSSQNSDNTLDFKLYFYILMELSAMSLDYEQIGYAKRARRFIDRITGVNTFPNDDPFIVMAKRWIEFGEAVAFYHLRGYHQAALNFSNLILDYKDYDELQKAETLYLGKDELALFYYPAVLFRSIIHLKSQFPYDCFQTLDLIKNSRHVSRYRGIKLQADIQTADALRQIERRKESAEKLKKLSSSFFPKFKWSVKPNGYFDLKDIQNLILPKKKTIEHQWNPFGLRTRFIELLINELLQRIKGIGYQRYTKESDFREWVESRFEPKDRRGKLTDNTIDDWLQNIISMFRIMKSFWPWVENNKKDRGGYYSQMAELLAWAVQTISRWKEEKYRDPPAPYGELNPKVKELRKIIKKEGAKLINNLKTSNNIPSLMKNSCSNCSIKLRLDHLSGGADYETLINNISDFLLKAESEWFKDLGKYRNKFAQAVMEKEKTKGENLYIDKVELINKLQLFKVNNLCIHCMDAKYSGQHNDQGIYQFNDGFSSLMACRKISLGAVYPDVNQMLIKGVFLEDIDYDTIMSEYEEHFLRHLNNNTIHDPKKMAVHFLGLQRWNSISPAEGRSLGGGYLLYRTNDEGIVDCGIAIDPGFDFIRNMFHCGFSLRDIDIIILSHSHLDHIRDFESIITLLKELHDRTGQFRRVHVILTLGVHRQLVHIFENPQLRRHIEPLLIDNIKDIDLDYFNKLDPLNSGSSYVFKFKQDMLPNGSAVRHDWKVELSIEKTHDSSNDKIVIWPTRAYHQDNSKLSDSFGFVIDLPLKAQSIRFGYTGDTKWVNSSRYESKLIGLESIHGIAEQYQNCDAILIHLGSLIDHKKGQKFKIDCNESKESLSLRCDRLIRKKNHPYLPGLIGFLNEIYNSSSNEKPKLILLSEFGEELRKKIRIDLINRLGVAYEGVCEKIMPVDVGLDIILGQIDHNEWTAEIKFWCCQCDNFHPIKYIEYQNYGHDEALYYLCKTCNKTSSIDVLQDKLRYLYEVGRSLKTCDE